MAKFHLWFSQKSSNLWQGHSQNTADARHSMGTLHLQVALYPGPAQLSVTCSMEKKHRLGYVVMIYERSTKGVWGMLPQKMLEFLSFLGRFWGAFVHF